MSSNSPQGFRNRRTLLVAAILSAATVMGLALIGTATDENGKVQAIPSPLATSIPSLEGVERFDHSGISPADPMEPDTTGASIAAYEM